MRVCGVKPQLHLDNGRSFSMLCKDGVIPIEENSQAKRSLSKDVFGRRTAPGGVPFFVLICLVATKSLLLSVFTRMQTIGPKIQEVHCSKRQNVHFRLTCSLIGSFSIDDGNDSENVSFKMNSRFFKLCRVYSNLLKMASVGEFPWICFPEDGAQV